MSRRRFGAVVLALSLLMAGVLCLPALPSSAPAAEAGIPQPAVKDKCPVCGMFVAKYPDWATVLHFKDGTPAFFDGPKDLFKYLLGLKRYNPTRKAGDVERIIVKDYYRVVPIDGKKAWYVLGSDVYGPMGKELIPLAKEADAETFRQDHKGRRILKFSEITPEVIKTVDQ